MSSTTFSPLISAAPSHTLISFPSRWRGHRCPNQDHLTLLFLYYHHECFDYQNMIMTCFVVFKASRPRTGYLEATRPSTGCNDASQGAKLFQDNVSPSGEHALDGRRQASRNERRFLCFVLRRCIVFPRARCFDIKLILTVCGTNVGPRRCLNVRNLLIRLIFARDDVSTSCKLVFDHQKYGEVDLLLVLFTGPVLPRDDASTSREQEFQIPRDFDLAEPTVAQFCAETTYFRPASKIKSLN
ncbi:hypothetical protein EDD85DRAFT_949595 [Armillaria nabsnona]|nr:hypothetical protein EDD85DRAFT_949595 [Armillaria nabsnona]